MVRHLAKLTDSPIVRKRPEIDFETHPVPFSEGTGARRRKLSPGVRRPAREDSHSSYNPGIETSVDLGKGSLRAKLVIQPAFREPVELLTRSELGYRAGLY